MGRFCIIRVIDEIGIQNCGQETSEEGRTWKT
jgi:hypothetical protein